MGQEQSMKTETQKALESLAKALEVNMYGSMSVYEHDLRNLLSKLGIKSVRQGDLIDGGMLYVEPLEATLSQVAFDNGYLGRWEK